MMKTRKVCGVLVGGLVVFCACVNVFGGWSAPELIAELNVSETERAANPCLSRDGLTMYFSRREAGSGYWRIMEAHRDTPDGVFTSERVLRELISTGLDLKGPRISAGGLRLYYTEGEVAGPAKIKLAQRASTGAPWTLVRALGELHPGGADALVPSLTEDELIIVFTSTRSGSAGTYDLWMASRASTAVSFGNIRPLYEINTSSWDHWAYIMPDGLTVYFSSADRGNDTDMNLYRAARNSLITTFENVERILIPFPSAAIRPYGNYVTADEKTIYFSAGGGNTYISQWIEKTGVFHVDGIRGSNSNDGSSRESAFATIQAGIDMAAEGSTVFVWPGVYNEQVNFKGKAITVQSAGDAAVVRATSGYAFSFHSGEGAASVLKNFVIRDSEYGIYLTNGCSPTLSHLTIVDNDYGISAYDGSSPDVVNCILWGNTYGDLFGCQARYSCVQDGSAGEGNIQVYPLFADMAAGDYHLKSARGRYVPPDSSLPEYGAPVNLVELNDGANKAVSPCVSADGLTMYFGRHIPSLGYACIVEAYRDSPEGPFTRQRAIDELGRDCVVPWISQDGLRLYYRQAVGSGLPRVKMAQRASKGDTWTYVRTFDELHVGDTNAAKPSLTGDELTIVFQSGRAGSVGGNDLWMATRSSTEAPFGNIRPLYEINTGQSEQSPCLLPDGLTVYFAGVDWPGHPGTYIYKAQRSSINDTFGSVHFVEYGDLSLYSSAPNVTADEKTIYFENTSAEGVYMVRVPGGQWLLDGSTSPCVDAGDPAMAPSGEPMPNGGRVDMGAYGGTSAASMSEWPMDGDINRDGAVDLADFAAMARDWMGSLPWHGE